MLLAHQPEPTKQHEGRERAEHNRERNHGTNHTPDRRRDATASLLLLRRHRSAVPAASVRSTRAGCVPALVAPLLAVPDCERANFVRELRVRDGGGVAAEKGEHSRLRILGRGAVVEQKPHAQILLRRETRRGVGVGDELEDQAGRVVDDAGEVGGGLGQVQQAEEAEGGRVGAELDAELLRAAGGDGAVHVAQDLARQLHAGDGAGVVRGVVGETVLVLVGEGEELVEGGVCQDTVGGDGGVVDFGYVDEVVDCKVFVSKNVAGGEILGCCVPT